jgi:hypothetical protein
VMRDVRGSKLKIGSKKKVVNQDPQVGLTTLQGKQETMMPSPTKLMTGVRLMTGEEVKADERK